VDWEGYTTSRTRCNPLVGIGSGFYGKERTSMAETNGGLIDSLYAWFKEPFSAKGSAFHWTLTVGLIIIAAFLWQLVLLEITRD
jgi:hypothetical protein